MLRVFVYEYLSGGAATLSNPDAMESDADAELLLAGRAMRDALVADLAELPGVTVTCACGSEAEETGLARIAGSGGAAVRPGAMEIPEAFVRRLAAAHDVAWIVAPESDGLLSRLAAVVEPAKWIGCTPAALHLCSHKRATIARLAAHGLLTPLAFDEQAAQWVVKPDDGAGCLDTRLHPTHAAAHADLQARRARHEAATLEPFVEGEAMSLSVLCGGPARAHGAELLSINRQRIELQPDGRLHDAGVSIGHLATDDTQDPRVAGLRSLALAVVRAVPGLRGFVGIDVVWHPQRGPVVIEVNPRVTCAYVGLSARLGRNLAGAVLAACGAPPEAAAPGVRPQPVHAPA